MKEKTVMRGVRLSAYLDALLTAEAEKERCSVSEIIRDCIEKTLTDTRWIKLFQELSELKQEMTGSREDIGISTMALLADAGRASAKEAQEFVKTQMGCR
jgi:hypothetical protein